MSNYKHLSITNLTSNNTFNDLDLLMISRETSEDIFTSYRVSADLIEKDFCNLFESLDSVVFTGSISCIGNGKINVDDKNIVDKKSVINVRYALENFMNKFLSLSNEIYNKPHIPSYVGEVIYSTSLTTLEKVQSKYGQNTIWESIPGRFIMGTNDNSLVGITTGEKEVKLNLENIPKHRHTVFMDSHSKKISVNEVVSPSSETVCKASKPAEPHLDGSQELYALLTAERKIVDDFAVEGNVEENGKLTSTRRIKIENNARINPNSGNNIAHNNIPPFYSVYIWKRIK